MTQLPPYLLRVEKLLMAKFEIVAAENGRSVNKEIEMLIKQAVHSCQKIPCSLGWSGGDSPRQENGAGRRALAQKLRRRNRSA